MAMPGKGKRVRTKAKPIKHWLAPSDTDGTDGPPDFSWACWAFLRPAKPTVYAGPQKIPVRGSMENSKLKGNVVGEASIHSVETVVLDESRHWGRSGSPQYVCMHRHIRTRARPSTSQQHSRQDCSGFLKEEIKTPGNILHLLCHIYFLWQPSVLFPWDSFRACLDFSLSGNLYSPPWPHREPPLKEIRTIELKEEDY